MMIIAVFLFQVFLCESSGNINLLTYYYYLSIDFTWGQLRNTTNSPTCTTITTVTTSTTPTLTTTLTTTTRTTPPTTTTITPKTRRTTMSVIRTTKKPQTPQEVEKIIREIDVQFVNINSFDIEYIRKFSQYLNEYKAEFYKSLEEQVYKKEDTKRNALKDV